MNFHERKKRASERKNIKIKSKDKLFNTNQIDPKAIATLTNGGPFSIMNVSASVKYLLSVFKDKPEFLGCDYEKSENNLIIKHSKMGDKKDVFVINTNNSELRWVLVNVIYDKQNGKTDVLYKDPYKCVTHCFKDVKDDEPKLHEMLDKENLDQLLNRMQNDLDRNLKKEFQEIQYFTEQDVNNLRINGAIDKTVMLSQNEKFKQELKRFIENLPVKLCEDVDKYVQYLETSEKGGEENIDYEKARDEKKKMLPEKDLKEFIEKYKDKDDEDDKIDEDDKNDEDATEPDLKLQITKEFPGEVKQLYEVFFVLEDVKMGDEMNKVVDDICNMLGIDSKKVHLFYKSRTPETKKVDTILKPQDINEVAKEIQDSKDVSTSEGCTPLKQLLKEIIIGKDDANHSVADVKPIEEKYHTFQKFYETWRKRSLREINKWAISKKNHLKNCTNDICEALAVMDRAFNLRNNGKFRLRDTQILSVLLFFHNTLYQGRMCQIKTGEGKTFIVSLIAMIKVLQGHTVDVVTSNPLLADDGVKSTMLFYSIFGITVDTNNPVKATEDSLKLRYTADVLYGTISNFQFDYLKETVDGLTIRQGRKFDQVIIDEVDSMLIDNGGQIAKLASPYPGMDCLRYIYIRIWQELHKAEEKFVDETKKRIADAKEKYSKNQDKLEKSIQEIIDSSTENERDILKKSIIASDPLDIPVVYKYLKKYTKSRLNVWIKNAIYAKYDCNEHEHYRIGKNDVGETVIIPVDYINTGVSLKNTIWSNGLHQFIQLKHNLVVTFENLTSSFISNLGYIKLYEKHNICGLTGTLGSTAEQNLLYDIYQISFAKIPTYKEKKFEELSGLIFPDKVWDEKLSLEIVKKIQENRAVLVICESERDLLKINVNLEVLKKSMSINIRTFAHEEQAEETEKDVHTGDIILATNIAGRGTNFKTSKELEKNGGLHVCVAFLPCNLRVEGQAFGRTSRQGNSGTGQLILKQSEVDELKIQDKNPNFLQIKQERDHLEKKRLTDIKEMLVPELIFKDELFKLFAKWHAELIKKPNAIYRFYVQDLKESWAFWLESQNYKGDTLEGKSANKEFQNFKEANEIIVNNKIIKQNPFHCLQLADHYMGMDKPIWRMMAKKKLEETRSLIDINDIPAYHMKLFELTIYEGEALKKKIIKTILKLIPIPLSADDLLNGYKDRALNHLNAAKKAIQTEVDYIDDNLIIKKDVPQSDLKSILIEDQEHNLFLKHIYSRFAALQIYINNMDELIKDIESNSHVDFDIGGKTPINMKVLDQDGNKNMSKIILEMELNELRLVGLQPVYLLKKLLKPPDALLKWVYIQVQAGVIALSVGLIFICTFPRMSRIARVFITEGITDLVMELLHERKEAFNEMQYLKSKAISYGKKLVSVGTKCALQSAVLLKAAIAACKKLADALRQCKFLKSVCTKVASGIEKLQHYFEKMLKVAEFNKLNKVDQLNKLKGLDPGSAEFKQLGGAAKLAELTKLEKMGTLRTAHLANFIVEMKQDFTKIGEKVIFKKMKEEALTAITDKIKKIMEDITMKAIKGRHKLLEKLQTTPESTIKETADKVLKNYFAETKEYAVKLAKVHIISHVSNENSAKLISEAIDVAKLTADCGKYIAFFLPLMEKVLGGDVQNDLDKMVKVLAKKLVERLWGLMMKMAEHCAKMIDTDKAVIPTLDDDEKDPYETLGVKMNADMKEIRQQYLQLTLQTLKFDKGKEAEDRFNAIVKAFETIKQKNTAAGMVVINRVLESKKKTDK